MSDGVLYYEPIIELQDSTGWDQSPKWDIIARLGYNSPNGI